MGKRNSYFYIMTIFFTKSGMKNYTTILPSKSEKASNTVTGKDKRQEIPTKMPLSYSV